MNERENGTIKWFKQSRGYGFITPLKGGVDVLLHANLCNQLGFKPLDGMAVQYQAVDTPKGRKAVWVGG
jgi:CspA family cold shock protein